MDYPQLKRTVYPDSSSQTHTDQAHFRDFRDYHLPLIRLHHTHLTRGIARGLEVRGTLGGTTITVEPGVAVDPQGQLLVLTRAETRETLTLVNRTLYVTLQFAEGRGLDGRLEQVPAEQVRLRDAPTLDSGSDEAVVVLALVKTDGTGRVTALQVQDGARRFRRQLLGEQVEALELRRAVSEGERVVDVPAGKLAAGEQGGLRLTVPGADDEILVAREDGGAFRRVEIRADVQVSGTIAGTLAAGAITSAHLAEADGTSGQETGTGQGVKTGHLQDQAVTSPKIADAAIQMGKLHPEVQRAIGGGSIENDAIMSAMIAEADGTSGQETGTGQGVKTGHLQDQAVTSPKIADAAIQMGKLHPEVQRAIGGGGIENDAIMSAMIAEADGTSGQETGTGQGVKTGHLQDQAVTSPKIADAAIELRNLHPEVRSAIGGGGIGTTPKLLIATSAAPNLFPWFLKDSYEDMWAFWLASGVQGENADIRYKRYSQASNSWGDDTQLTTHAVNGGRLLALEDRAGDIWVFWSSERGGNTDIRYKRYSRASDSWGDDTQLTTHAAADRSPFALEDRAGDIWVFWTSERGGILGDIWYKRYSRASNSWGNDTQLTTHAASDHSPFALEDRAGDIWVFWTSERSGAFHFWYKRYSRASDSWGNDTQLTTDATDDFQLFALEDRAGDIWVFWTSDSVGAAWDIWYKRYSRASNSWGNDTQLTTDPSLNSESFALEDRAGDIWVFWTSPRSGAAWDIWYKRYSRASNSWGNDTQLTTDAASDDSPFALEDRAGAIWVFGRAGQGGRWELWYKKMFLAI